jgi:hypothetical protein
MIVTKGGGVELKVMVIANFINYALGHVRKLRNANILKIYYQYSLE